MRSITADDFRSLYRSISRSFAHLEMRDSYGTEVELPQMARWKAGESDDLSWLSDWCDLVSYLRAHGKRCRRAKVVSLPLSEYQRWNASLLPNLVGAGEEISWVDRRAASTIAMPPSDFYLLDEDLVVFLHFSGAGKANGYTEAYSGAR